MQNDPMQNEEVRLTHLRPAEFSDRRDAVRTAWLPLGTMEWHGRHMPLGLDGVKAELICIEGARRLGGVVFPTMYWGDHRGIVVESLLTPDVTFVPTPLPFDHREKVNETLATSSTTMAAQGRRDEDGGVAARHIDLLVQALWTIRTYGFDKVVAFAGHYPNLSPALAAIERFHDAQTTCRAIVGHELTFAQRPNEVRHADTVETSLLLALDPSLASIERLDVDVCDPIGVMGDDPRGSSAAEGRQLIDETIAGIARLLATLAPRDRSPAPGGPDEDGTLPTWPAGMLTAPRAAAAPRS